MSPLLTKIVDLLDPRGRCNRQGLAVLAGALLVAEIALGLWLYATDTGVDGIAPGVMKAVVVWIAMAAGIRRLHDIGRTGWWLAAALAGLFVWSLIAGIALVLSLGVEKLVPGELGFLVLFGLTMLPVVAGGLWLHVTPGHAGDNRYGPEPLGIGLSAPHATSVVGTRLDPLGTAGLA